MKTSELAEQIRELRDEYNSLREEVSSLRAEVMCLRAQQIQVVPPSIPQPTWPIWPPQTWC